ncbi:tetratricopeptide repeat protein [Actinomadura madurae]|uniref:tetratricopeptide repeat protein n=1 Tax=Actinomadura madurae TaxID=1993 RepID=UPI00399A83CD
MWWLVLLAAAGAAAASAQWVPADWPLGWRVVLAVGAAVAAGAAGSYVSEWLNARRARAAAVEGMAAAAVLPASGGPASHLVAARRVVEFVGRRDELADLIAWCEGTDAGRVRLLTGPGGVGKSRLGVELCVRLSEVGWRCVQVADGAETTAVDTVRAVSGGRVLLVVDYAEVRVGLPRLLRAVAADDGAALRVLLLSRSAGEWWDRLSAAEPAVRDLLANAYSGADLAAVVETQVSDDELVAAAVPAFAAELGVHPAPSVRAVTGEGRARILDLHAAALVAVLQAADSLGSAGGVVRVEVADVLAELLAHEERFWMGSAQRAGLLDGTSGLRPEVVRRIVAAGCLLGAASEADAVALLGRVPGAAATARVAGWLRDLYPPHEDGDWLGSLHPDRLAEHHTIAQLTQCRELAEACLQDLDDRQALRAVTLLGRASTDQPAAASLLEQTLPLLDRVIVDLPPDVDLLTAITNAIPYPSLSLAEADLAVTRRILEALPPGPTAERARWLSWLGTTLTQTGQLAEALPVEQEAVQIRRELAEAYPDRYRPDLAISLSNLGVTYSEMGRPTEALPVAEEAVQIRRELAEAHPDRYRSHLAEGLTNLGVTYSEVGRLAEALPVEQEAVNINRELAEAYPDRYRPDLASSLANLGAMYSEVGRPAEALPVTEEAVQIFRGLAEAYPDPYRPDLASSLANLGAMYSEVGRLAEALPVEQEAVNINRELAEAYPDRYRPDLASSLRNLGITYSAVGRPVEALPVEQEAVLIRRGLAEAYPDRYRPDLASSLRNLVVTYSEVGRPAEALPVAEEAVQIYRELAETYPDRYRPDLARSLANLGAVYSAVGRPEEGREARDEAQNLLPTADSAQG